MPQIIDLRSDTFTLPTSEMKEFMYNAPLGDDVFGEDPSVNELQEYTASLFGKEAGLFFPSGTMSNQVAIKTHTNPGEEVICEAEAHVYVYECAGIAFHSQCQVKSVQGQNGIMKAHDIKKMSQAGIGFMPKTSLLCVEQTLNRGGGNYYSMNELQEIYMVCKEKNLSIHLDGARVFNALVATGDLPKEYGKIFDSISICLSKGLGAPVGSVLIGSRAFIDKARRVRKLFGGGMRQAGVLASAGLYALKHHVVRLADDHQHAKMLYDTLKTQPYIEKIFPAPTNIIIFEIKPHIRDDEFLQTMKSNGILFLTIAEKKFRMVTRLGITKEMTEFACKKLSEYKKS